jgi:RNA polymerase sigma-70 factor (ECF subfamily)
MTDSDTKAFFGAGVEENIDALYGVALRLTRKDADAEDLVAEAVTKAWSSIDTLSDRDRFRPWLFRILHNIFISDYRKQSVRPVEASYNAGECDDDDLVTLLNEQSDDFLVWWSNPERAFFNDLLGEQLLEGFTYDETAEVLGVAPGTVRSRMKRGRTLLQKALWQQRPAPERCNT